MSSFVAAQIHGLASVSEGMHIISRRADPAELGLLKLLVTRNAANTVVVAGTQHDKCSIASGLQADIDRVREVYDAFLAEFPLCYGYWKKYADAEARWGTLEHAAHVYERGVASIPYSIDLWGHFAMFKQNQGASHEDMQGCVL